MTPLQQLCERLMHGEPLASDRERLARACLALIEGLEFYQDHDNWDNDEFCPTVWDNGDIDLGRIAEATLKRASAIANGEEESLNAK